MLVTNVNLRLEMEGVSNCGRTGMSLAEMWTVGKCGLAETQSFVFSLMFLPSLCFLVCNSFCSEVSHWKAIIYTVG
jgi:hypothetical protein